jgi:transaldolase
MSRWTAVAELGQSIWYDNVARPALADGHLARLVDEDAVTGGTSNPSIFAKAVLDSALYDDQLTAAPPADGDAAIFERCWIEDIQRACDVVRPVWETTGGRDGYISIEEEADLAFEVEAAVARAHELRALVDRPNVMVKVPGTDAGVEAFRRLTREGLSINMTLLFSRERYREIAEGYIVAMTERLDAGEDVSGVHSVASFFVSRASTCRSTGGCRSALRCVDGSRWRTPRSRTPTSSFAASRIRAGSASPPRARRRSARSGPRRA